MSRARSLANLALGTLVLIGSKAWSGTEAQPDKAAAKPEAEQAAEPAAPPPNWEAAAGLFVNFSPSYPGSASQHAAMQLGYYLRRGRWSLTNRSDLITRTGESVVSGLAADLVDSAALRLAAGLRIDSGRGSSADPALAGLDAVPATLRLRLVTETRGPGPWQGSLALSSDLLRRGGGNTLNLRAWRDWALWPGTRLNIGAGVSAADSTYLQSWFGVNEAESIRTGHPVYLPSTGFTDCGVGANLRVELADAWVLFASGNLSRLLGPAAQSPLTQRLGGWGINLGLGRKI